MAFSDRRGRDAYVAVKGWRGLLASWQVDVRCSAATPPELPLRASFRRGGAVGGLALLHLELRAQGQWRNGQAPPCKRWSRLAHGAIDVLHDAMSTPACSHPVTHTAVVALLLVDRRRCHQRADRCQPPGVQANSPLHPPQAHLKAVGVGASPSISGLCRTGYSSAPLSATWPVSWTGICDC